MAFGLPVHLAAQTSSRSFAIALRTAAYTCLVVAFLIVLVFQAAEPGLALWPAGLALLPMGFLLWVHGRDPTAFYSAGYLIVGGAGTYWYALTLYSQLDSAALDDVFSISLAKIALVLVAGTGVGLAAGLAWASAGLVVAELASTAAVVSTGRHYQLDVATLLAFLAAAAIFVVSAVIRRRSRRMPPRLHRAARDDQLAEVRYRIELKAAALMHDTVLSHLAAIAGSTGERLNPQLGTRMARDLEILIGEEWLSPASSSIDAGVREDWRESGLFVAIQESRLLGLEIDATGDLATIGRLDGNSSVAVGLAAKQCLVNVLKHSGSTHAEVAVYGSDTEVSVMVIDDGRGFTPAATASDRLGLRNSVRRRIEGVGGTVQIWSTIGLGTSVMIRVPVGSAVKGARPAQSGPERA